MLLFVRDFQTQWKLLTPINAIFRRNTRVLNDHCGISFKCNIMAFLDEKVPGSFDLLESIFVI